MSSALSTLAHPTAASTNQALPARTPSPAAKRLRPMTAGATRGASALAGAGSPASSKKKAKKKTGAAGATPKRKARPKTAKVERETKTVSFDSFLTVSGLTRSELDGSAVVTPTKQPKLRSVTQRPGSAPPKQSRHAVSPAGRRLAVGPLASPAAATPDKQPSAAHAAPWTTSSAGARHVSWEEAADAAYALLARTSLAPFLDL